jgi:MIP family channel proteins
MQKTLRPLAAEFIGVFMLTFISAGAIILNTYRDGIIGLVGIALASGLAYAVAVTATMNISGGHINPAVTVGLWSVGRIGWRQAGLYVAAQLLGAVLAALALKGLYPGGAGQVAQLGTPRLASDVTFTQGVLVEAILTFFLAFAVMATAVDAAAPKVAGWAIGLTVAMGMLAGGGITGGAVSGGITGAALNPARAFGPALVSNAWLSQLVYWIGPILGAVAAMQVYERLLLKRDAA